MLIISLFNNVMSLYLLSNHKIKRFKILNFVLDFEFKLILLADCIFCKRVLRTSIWIKPAVE